MTETATTGPWTVTESSWDPARANFHETIFTVGNGRLGTRGSLEERHLGAVTGTYLAGVYDGYDAAVTDLVNCPDWLATEVYVDGERLDTQSMTVVEHQRTLDLRTGVLHRDTVFANRAGHRFRLVTRRVASMADRDLCALRIEVTPLDADAQISVLTGIDGNRRNLERLLADPHGTKYGYDRKWQKWSLSTHLAEREHGFDGDVGYLVTETIESKVTIAYAYRLTLDAEPAQQSGVQRYEYVGSQLIFAGTAGTTIGIDKLIGIATSRDPGLAGTPLEAAQAVLARHAGESVEEVQRASAEHWAQLWHDCDCEIDGDDHAALAVRFGIYHLLITANPDDPTVNIGAKSLSGEGYRGHVFWDTEIMMLPFFLHTQPATARALLAYRHHTLPGALEVSKENGTGGARFPWESADTGREECPQFTPDGANRIYPREEEIHVSADVAFGFLRYAEVTGDEEFLFNEGAEVLFETSRFWLDRCTPEGDQLALRTVMGPDEFHSHVDNNAFTNWLVAWQLRQAAALYDRMDAERPEELAALSEKIGLSPEEPKKWLDAVGRMMAVPGPDAGLIEQFEGYFQREDVPIVEWDENDMPRYPEGYHHHNCEDTMLLKQPDSVMLVYMFPDEFSMATRKENFEFYEARTLHKSSLSPSIHAIVGLQVGDASRALQYFGRSAFVDLDDNQGNTEDGMHIASAGGTWQIAVNGFGGFRAVGSRAHFDPRLPESWRGLTFVVQLHGRSIRAALGHDESVFELLEGASGDETIVVDGKEVSLSAGVPVTVRHTA